MRPQARGSMDAWARVSTGPQAHAPADPWAHRPHAHGPMGRRIYGQADPQAMGPQAHHGPTALWMRGFVEKASIFRCRPAGQGRGLKVERDGAGGWATSHGNGSPWQRSCSTMRVVIALPTRPGSLRGTARLWGGLTRADPSGSGLLPPSHTRRLRGARGKREGGGGKATSHGDRSFWLFFFPPRLPLSHSDQTWVSSTRCGTRSTRVPAISTNDG